MKLVTRSCMHVEIGENYKVTAKKARVGIDGRMNGQEGINLTLADAQHSSMSS